MTRLTLVRNLDLALYSMIGLSHSILVDGAVMEAGTSIEISSPNLVSKTEDEMVAKYSCQNSKVTVQDGKIKISVEPTEEYLLKTDLKAPGKLGLMLVGWGGNNGSTLTASLLANKLGLSWETRRGTETANFLGSLVMSSTVPLGVDSNQQPVNIRMHDVVPFVNPSDIVIGGWDISSMSIGDALIRSRVLEPDLIRQVKPELDKMKPLPSIFDSCFVASNQASRADNVLSGPKLAQIDQICADIEDFKRTNGLDKVIVMWTANTERICEVKPNVHDTYHNLVKAIVDGDPDVSPSTMFAVASILCKCPFINGSPQNTLVPAVLDLAERLQVPIAGDDFKSGQTKIKSVLVDFLVSSGIKPLSIASYNHLGNNDGKNLAESAQFQSKEQSKRGVVEDMVASNPVLYPVGKEGPDHKIVIEYIPAVGDSKRALDEYENEIFMGGRNTLVMHNTCEDSLLAAPLMLDLVLLMEFFQRIKVAKLDASKDGDEQVFQSMSETMSLLAFCMKAPLFPKGCPVVNSLVKQRRAIETILRACIGLPPTDDLNLSQRL